ncbi:pilus assembly protein TadG-related protein [Chloroflexota bacterium]
MKRFFMSYSRGQSMVFVVFMTFIIIGVMALSIDMGYTYYIRRWAQNTADSAALAAARELCIDTDPLTRYTNAINAATDYTENKNLASGINSQTITEIKFNVPSIPELHDSSLQPGEVRVDVAINHPNFVAQQFGLDSTTVPARAAAGCFAPGAAYGVIPIAWKCHRTYIEDGVEKCDMKFISDDEECALPDDYMYLFIEADDRLFWCTELGPPPEIPEELAVDVVLMTCGNNIEIVNTSSPIHSWSWVDLDGTTGQYCSTNELRGWVEDGFGGTISTHTWVPGCTGGMTDIYGSVIDLDDSVIPVFDMVCESDYPETYCNGPEPTYPDLWHDDVDIALDSLNAPFTFHLLTFAKLRISCVDAQGNKCDQLTHARQFILDNNEDNPDPKSDLKNIETIEGCMVEGFIPGLSGKPSDGVDSGAWTLYLTR